MAKVTEGFLLGTHEGLTFYLLHGRLYVRRKSSLSRQRVLYSPRFAGTRQSAGELATASRMASRVYRELTGEQKRRVRGLFKKMTGVVKIALKWGKGEGEAEEAVRLYLVEMGVVKEETSEEKKEKAFKVEEKGKGTKTIHVIRWGPRVFRVPREWFCMSNSRPGRYPIARRRVALFGG